MGQQRFKYICTNSDCEGYMKDQIVRKEEEQENEKEICINCLQVLKPVGIVPYGGFASFSSLTSEDKKKMLLKRSHEHYKKHVRDRKEQYLKDFTNEVNVMKNERK